MATEAANVLGVTFYWRAHEVRGEWRDLEYVRIQIPGDKSSILDRPVNDEDRRRYAREYEAWKRGESQIAAAGTPLIALDGVSHSQVETLRSLGINTIEQLAALPDGNGTFMGWVSMKQKAQAHVEAMRVAAPVNRALRAIEDRDSELAELRREIAALKAKGHG